jgi:hypothetical protein
MEVNYFVCKECYSTDNRVTPILNPRECLENHKQYICGTCGRCICIDKDPKRNLQRWNFPFKSLETAKLYLRSAEATVKNICGIYEIISKNGRISYKIFSTNDELENYLKKNPDKKCNMKPIYQNKKYIEYENTQIRKLKKEEVEKYMEEKEK